MNKAHWAQPTEIEIKKIAIVLFLTLIYHCVPSGTLHKNKLTNAVLYGVE